MASVMERQTVSVGYVGEMRNNLRQGYGVYTYPNTFFEYEGEWDQGLKDGFGKLKMRDGSYYEGQFRRGEIAGTGCRYWAHSGNYYEGNFEAGEMTGQGVMRYGDGRLYEGSWKGNKIDGKGVMKHTNGDVYDGVFYNHKRHGEGRLESNGSVYEGGWINDTKHGSGNIVLDDGTLYQGQWRADLMNGEGSLQHPSGINYQGLWCNGRPQLEPVRMINENQILTVDKNDVVFSVEVKCVTDGGEVTPECGRTLKVTAGVRSKKNASSGNRKQRGKSSGLNTPFGFFVDPYPLTSKAAAAAAMISSGDDEFGLITESLAPPNSNPSIDSPPPSVLEVLPAINVDTRIESAESHPQEESTEIHYMVPLQQTVNGQTTFVDLMLPYVSSNDQTKQPTAPTSLSPEQNLEPRRSKVNKNRRMTDLSIAKFDNDDKESNSKRRKALNAKGEEKGEEFIDEKFCRPGDYVIIVEDATENPFLDIRLDPLFIHVKVASKRSRSRTENK